MFAQKRFLIIETTEVNFWTNIEKKSSPKGDLVYFVAACCIVYNRRYHKQAYYLHHNDDILCLTMHPQKQLVASGETGKNPSICIWDSVALKTVSVLVKEHCLIYSP